MTARTAIQTVMMICALGLAQVGFSKTIGLDGLHGDDPCDTLGTGPAYEEMRAELQLAGYSLRLLTDFEPATLAECDAIFVLQSRDATTPFSTQQIDNIHAFVDAGGGLLAICDGRYSRDVATDNNEPLLAPYGVLLDDRPADDHGYVATQFVAHVVTTGLSSVGQSSQHPLMKIAAPAIDLTLGEDDDFLAAVTGTAGAGNVVIISDSGPFQFPGEDTNLYAEDNLQLVLNTAQYLTMKKVLVIGLDAVHGELPTFNLGLGTSFEKMQEELESAGYAVVPLHDFKEATLKECNAIFLLQPTALPQAYRESDIASIRAYVAGGGGLLAVSEGGYRSDYTVANFEDLLAPYGVIFAGKATMGDGHVVSGFVPHAVTLGLVSVGLDFERPLIKIKAPAIDLTLGGGDDNMLAALAGTAGAGNVVVICDSAPFSFPGYDTNIYAEDNLQLLLNIARYVTMEN